jgi:RHS repeat-associated protein
VTEGTVVVEVDYLDGYQYKNGVLSYFPTAEGYVDYTVSKWGAVFNYVYQYKDHLGNVRVNYTYVGGSSGQLTGLFIKEENHYYPFGLQHANYNVDYLEYQEIGENVVLYPPLNANDKLRYNYKYNGKELQDELGLAMYDYGARFYDPATGRWYTIDQMAEKYDEASPYAYALNNPVIYIDPDGNQVEMCCEGFQKFMRKLDRAAEYYGEKIMRKVANTLPPIAATNAIKGATTGTNIYGQTVTTGQIISDGVGAIPVAKGGQLIKTGIQGIITLSATDEVTKKTEKETGSYTTEHESGMKYHGKGDEKRAKQSGDEKAKKNNDPVKNIDHTPAKNDREAFKQESRRIDSDRVGNTPGHKSPNNYNKRASPGDKYRQQDGD